MADRKNYYGNENIESLSYLEFGSIDIKEGKKSIWAYWQDQDAYDMYMFSRYARDLFLFRKFLDEKEKTVCKLNEYVLMTAHTKLMDYLLKYAALISVEEGATEKYVCESGSSLYGWIDEAIAMDTVYYNGKNIERIQSMPFLGSDISEFMNQGAATFHSNMNLCFSTAPTMHKLMEEERQYALVYGLGVSMRYTLRGGEDLLEIAEKSDLAVFNRLSFTRSSKTVQMIYGTGKYEYIISLPEVVDLLEQCQIKAYYCTANMQEGKDGPDSIRVSVAISRDGKRIEEFIQRYGEIVGRSLMVEGVIQGEWRNLAELAD